MYELNLSTYCPEFIPILEEWLQVWRPKLPNAATSPCVFLTSGGHSYDEASLRVGLSEAVSMYTGKRFFPHMVRTVWATEFLERHPGAYDAVATALGDTVAVVIKTYQNIVEQEQRAKGAAFLSEALQRG